MGTDVKGFFADDKLDEGAVAKALDARAAGADGWVGVGVKDKVVGVFGGLVGEAGVVGLVLGRWMSVVARGEIGADLS